MRFVVAVASVHEGCTMIPGGYYIKARKIRTSKIAHKSPHIREIWDWLIGEAAYRDTQKGGYLLKRGQCLYTTDDIRNGLMWLCGNRPERYSSQQVKRAIKFLRDEKMITTQKTQAGLLITVINYRLYQDPDQYDYSKSDRTVDDTATGPWDEPPTEPDTTDATDGIIYDYNSNDGCSRTTEQAVDDTATEPLHEPFYNVVNNKEHKEEKIYKNKEGGNYKSKRKAHPSKYPHDTSLTREEIQQARYHESDPVYQVADILRFKFEKLTGKKTFKVDIRPIFDLLCDYISPDDIEKVMNYLNSDDPWFKDNPNKKSIPRFFDLRYFSENLNAAENPKQQRDEYSIQRIYGDKIE